MITREDLLRSNEYWIETIQNKIYNDLIEFIEKNNISNKSIARKLGLSKGRVSQILNGENLNFRLDTLVRICLAIERIPDFRLIEIDEFINNDRISDVSQVFSKTKEYPVNKKGISENKVAEVRSKFRKVDNNTDFID